MKLPPIKDVRRLLIKLKSDIGTDYRASGCEDESVPSMDVTIGWTPESGEWAYQTGDNGYMGAAYNHRHWALVTLTRRANTLELAQDVLDQLEELAAND